MKWPAKCVGWACIVVACASCSTSVKTDRGESAPGASSAGEPPAGADGRAAAGSGSSDPDPAMPPGDAQDPAGVSDPSREPAGFGTEIFGRCEGGEPQPGPRLLRLLTRFEYSNTVRDLLFLNDIDVSTLPLEARVRGYDNNARAQAVTSRHVDTYMDLGRELAERAVQQSRGQLLSCELAASDCPQRFVERLGRRAFRRPLSAEEVSRYTALFSEELTGGDLDEGMRLAIRAMLLSPAFLYRSEVGTEQPDGTYLLGPYEVASALSYLYWGSMPDQELFAAAERDELRTPEQLRAQAARLLGDARAEEQLYQFALQWLRTDKVLDAFKDPAIFPSFNDHVREAMLEEQRRLFAGVALEEGGSFAELFTPDYVHVNQALADFYGLSAMGQQFARVPAGDSERGGILGLGAVLAAHAHSNDSSPIKRGVFVRDRLLCQELPPPPEDLDTTPPGLDPTLTTRERFARHTSDAACSGCHQYIDGIGFGFEGFDGSGKQRSMENGMPIDTSGEIVGIERLTGGTSHDFDGPAELAALLADSDSAKACLVLQYYRYGRGYEERPVDACSLAALQARFQDSGFAVRELMVGLSQLRSFVVREAP